MQKIEHIGIVVNNIDEANNIFEKIIGKKNYKQEHVISEDVSTSFFKLGESKIELIASKKTDHTINKYLKKIVMPYTILLLELIISLAKWIESLS